jgi:gas vesicle protein
MGSSKVGYFLAGVGIGTLVGVLAAPRSGEETREYLSQRAEEGRKYAQRKARELRYRAEDFVERGKQVASDQRELITGALDAGREAYRREKSKEI